MHPEVWFAKLDAQFTTRGITSEHTEFDNMVVSLFPEYATEVRDIILKPLTTEPYKALKMQLIKHTTASEQKRLQLLFNTEKLGDTTPSQFLRRMHQLLGDKTTSTNQSFVKELFLQRLPPTLGWC